VSEVVILAGTRPEGVKVAPLAVALTRDGRLSSRVVDTGQQPGRVGEALQPFGLAPDVVLQLDRPTGTLAELVSNLTTALDAELTRRTTAAVVVQGDTVTTLVGALVAFWQRIPVVHLEAGLRSHDLDQPFPEEANRAMVARIAALHLAPTPEAVRHLLAEGLPPDRVVLTGNTIVDAMWRLLDSGLARPPAWLERDRAERVGRLVVATAHRRENWGEGIAGVCHALARLTRQWAGTQAVLATHPNPALTRQVRAILGDTPGVRLTPPLAYPEMLGLLSQADLVITDSGGLQEEAVTLGIPVLVTRVATERPEVLTSGLGHLVGTDPDRIVATAIRLLSNRLLSSRIGPVTRHRPPTRVGRNPLRPGALGSARWAGMSRPRSASAPDGPTRLVLTGPALPVSPFGDGHAGVRAAAAIAHLLGLPPVPTPRRP
jgi:UDP-N-acetylglucosamine 2-epimerase (non-hydrolysing)